MTKPTLRTCIAGGGTHEKSVFLRFVKGPDDMVWFDITNKAPGRGAYVYPNKEHLERACKKNAFKRKLNAQVPDNLPQTVLQGVKKQLLQNIGLAKRGSNLVLGLDKVNDLLKTGNICAVLIAADASENAAKKVQTWQKHGLTVLTIGQKQWFEDATGVSNCTVIGLNAQGQKVMNLAQTYINLTA